MNNWVILMLNAKCVNKVTNRRGVFMENNQVGRRRNLGGHHVSREYHSHIFQSSSA